MVGWLLVLSLIILLWLFVIGYYCCLFCCGCHFVFFGNNVVLVFIRIPHHYNDYNRCSSSPLPFCRLCSPPPPSLGQLFIFYDCFPIRFSRPFCDLLLRSSAAVPLLASSPSPRPTPTSYSLQPSLPTSPFPSSPSLNFSFPLLLHYLYSPPFLPPSPVLLRSAPLPSSHRSPSPLHTPSSPPLSSLSPLPFPSSYPLVASSLLITPLPLFFFPAPSHRPPPPLPSPHRLIPPPPHPSPLHSLARLILCPFLPNRIFLSAGSQLSPSEFSSILYRQNARMHGLRRSCKRKQKQEKEKEG